jgi:small subunit ribosomal protein S16
MLRIRLSRIGKKGHPSYRIVVADVTAPRDGAYLEWIGNYDPMADPPVSTIKADRATHWLNLGAQPSDPVLRILDKNGILERTHRFRTSTAAATPEAPAAPTPVAVAAAPPEEAPADEPESEAPADEPIAEAPADDAEPEAPVDEAPAEEAEPEAPAEDS